MNATTTNTIAIPARRSPHLMRLGVSEMKAGILDGSLAEADVLAELNVRVSKPGYKHAPVMAYRNELAVNQGQPELPLPSAAPSKAGVVGVAVTIQVTTDINDLADRIVKSGIDAGALMAAVLQRASAPQQA